MTATLPHTDRKASPAMDLLAPFAARVLPSTVRRIAAWRGLSRATTTDLLEDVRQELALDCLLHGAAIVALPEPERHRRWMRLAERWIYRQRRHGWRRPERAPEQEEPAIVDPAPRDEADVPELPATLLVHMRNGRCNISASARSGAGTRHSLRRQIDAIAGRLGLSDRTMHFWRSRVGETLTGLAADLLRLRGEVHVVPMVGRLPDPQARLARLRRLQRRVPVWRHTMDLRRTMRRWVQTREFLTASPRELLEHAVELDPFAATTWLWLFEACVVDGDLVAAARALLRVRHLPPRTRATLALARVRLREARGNPTGALALLDRICARHPGDGLLRRVQAGARAPSPGHEAVRGS